MDPEQSLIPTEQIQVEIAIRIGRTRMSVADLARLQAVVGQEYVADADAFSDDDGNVHEQSIDRLAAAGVVQGVAAGRYDPFGPVSRQQMSAFLMRYVDDRIEAGDMSSRYTG